MSFDKKLRLAIEETIDNLLKEGTEENVRSILIEQGIEPTLETVLSHIAGTIFGLANGYYAAGYKRPMNTDEGMELLKFIKRRVYELREEFVKTRIKEGR